MEVVRASPKENTEETKVGRKDAVYLDDNTEGTVSEDEEKEVAPDGAHDSKTALPAVTLAESSVGDQDAAGTAAVAEGGGQVVAGVVSCLYSRLRSESPLHLLQHAHQPG